MFIVLTTNMAAFNCHMVVNQEFLPGVSYMYATGSSQTWNISHINQIRIKLEHSESIL